MVEFLELLVERNCEECFAIPDEEEHTVELLRRNKLLEAAEERHIVEVAEKEHS